MEEIKDLKAIKGGLPVYISGMGKVNFHFYCISLLMEFGGLASEKGFFVRQY